MPTVNIYYGEIDQWIQLQPQLLRKLRGFIAEKLSGSDRKLTPEEISIRLIKVQYSLMIVSLELDITAHAYEERIARQDEICSEIRAYAMKVFPREFISDVRVWLQLCELGHSWED